MTNKDVVYIQLSFRKVDIKLLSDFHLDKPSVNSKMSNTDYNTIISTKNIVVSTNESSSFHE